MKSIFKKIMVVFVCLLLFFSVSYAYLYFNFNKPIISADQKNSSVAYERRPENKSIVFEFPDSSAVLAHLDFENMCIRLLNIQNFIGQQGDYNGYTADFVIQTDYRLVEGIVDRIGGINMNYDGTDLRYTGSQVIEIISVGCSDDLKRQLLMCIFEQISKNNFSKDDFVYIIENSQSNLSVIDCLDWTEYIKDMSSRVEFIN